MSITFFILTTPNHIKHLERIIKSVEGGTIQPDEFIINISEYPKCDFTIINNLRKKYPYIYFKENENVLLAGPNKQCAEELSNKDIIIYQDSDDIPHPQRIEVIKYIFEHNDILHVNHSFTKNENFSKINLNNIRIINSNDLYNKYFPNNKIEGCLKITGNYGGEFGIYIHGGSLSIKKQYLKKLNGKPETT